MRTVSLSSTASSRLCFLNEKESFPEVAPLVYLDPFVTSEAPSQPFVASHLMLALGVFLFVSLLAKIFAILRLVTVLPEVFDSPT